MAGNPSGKNYYAVVFRSMLDDEIAGADAKPSEVFGDMVYRVVIILGVSLIAAATPDVFGEVY